MWSSRLVIPDPSLTGLESRVRELEQVVAEKVGLNTVKFSIFNCRNVSFAKMQCIHTKVWLLYRWGLLVPDKTMFMILMISHVFLYSISESGLKLAVFRWGLSESKRRWSRHNEDKFKCKPIFGRSQRWSFLFFICEDNVNAKHFQGNRTLRDSLDSLVDRDDDSFGEDL